MVALKTKVLKTLEKGHRKAIVKTSAIDPNGYTVWFYFDGWADYEWKRGAGGIAMDNCDTLQQAIGKARRYVNQ